MIKESEPIFSIQYAGRNITFYNQRSRLWTQPYAYVSAPEEDLHAAGCGLFSLSHALEWMNDVKADPVELADFSLKYGGREEDGTNRPALLAACMDYGFGQKYRFRYDYDGLLNNKERLWEHISQKKGVALCNLRKGHIVALVDSKVMPTGERAFLAIDSFSESTRDTVRNHVLQVVEQSLVSSNQLNQSSLYVGSSTQYGMFWVKAELPMDYNLIYKNNEGGK